MQSSRCALLAVLALFVGIAVPLVGGGSARAESAAALLAKATALPEMALGSTQAPITIFEYSSMTCPHCAGFAENVLPMLQSKYIDTGKVRFVSRPYPLDPVAVSASMLAYCIAKGDASKFFDASTVLFKQQEALTARALETLKSVGSHFGMSAETVEACELDQAMLTKIQADQRFGYEKLKVDATPTFFINGEKLRGSMSFEELDKKLTTVLKR